MSEKLEKKIGYTFSDPFLLEKALTHSSTENKEYDNERLEFLGDRVLGLSIADQLFTFFPEEEEGSLAKRHAGFVQQSDLVLVAQMLGLADHLKLSVGEIKSGGQMKEKILSDAMEALIGAIYLDGGFGVAHDFVKKFWGERLRLQISPPEDAKSRLQEWAQAKSIPLPKYTLINKSGTSHSPIFEMEVFVTEGGKAVATAKSKRAAEKSAALKMLQKIGIKI